MTKVAVVLAGCGHKDGAEIREAVLSLLYLDQQGADVSIFAPDMPQTDVINHLTGEVTRESRNVLVEAARIARGDIRPLSQAKAQDFDALVLPGGFGAAKNLSDLAMKGKDATVIPDYKRLLTEFLTQKKPIGAICISPAVLTAAVGKEFRPAVTIGEDAGTASAITAMGGIHETKATDHVAIDPKNKIASCSAYMRDDRLSRVASGIEKVISEVMNFAKQAQRNAA